MKTTASSFDWPEGRRWQRQLLLVGIASLCLCAIGAAFDVQQFFRSYLLGFFSWLGIALGSLAILMLHNLTGGAWGLTLRPLFEAATRTLPLLAVLFLPIAFGLDQIYPWSNMDRADLGAKAAYLNVPFFLARAVGYFAIWIGLALLLNRWSAAHDRTGDPAMMERTQQLSAPGLVLYGLTVTFASIDWVMSLQPEWSSTIFGAVVATGQLLPALALAIAVAAALPRSEHAAAPSTWNDLGSLLLAFVMLWSYMAFSQYLIIWSGNLPEEISWYVNRTVGGWQLIAVVLAAFYFALPFFLLLSRDVKQDPQRLQIVAVVILAMSFVHQYWLIAPTFSPRHLYLHWMDIAAMIGVGALWLSVFLWQVQARPLMPVHEPLPKEALHHA